MTGNDLTREQAEKIGNYLAPTRMYLERLLDRMSQAGFPANDPLEARVRAARDAMQALAMALHYQGCSGVGRPSQGDCDR